MGNQGIDMISRTSSVPASGATHGHQMHLNSSVTSPASFAARSLQELVKLPLRAVYQAEIFAFVTIPQSLARLVGFENVVNTILMGNTRTIRVGDTVAATATPTAASIGLEGATEAGVNNLGSSFSHFFHAMKRFSGFFSYMMSRWSLACFFVALVLNRVTIYASTRRRPNLRWESRLFLRSVPIILFIMQILKLLCAIRCQTSPDYSLLRYGRPGKRMPLDYAGDGGFLYMFSSTLLSWETDQQSCKAVGMGQPGGGSEIPYGSFALLWPIFTCLCLSHFVETLSCALQGRSTGTEAGMSIFEHSLAFAEAETMISQSIGLGLFGLPKQPSKDILPLTAMEGSSSSVQLLTRAQVLERMNVTPELLLIVLISCCNSLTSNILDVFGKQGRYRLVNTTLWGLCFMGAMLWGFLDSSSFGSETGVLKFPTVCIVGFVPHLLILMGILICLYIYGIALLITAFSLPPGLPQPSSWRERFALAHENMQGASQIRDVRLNMHEDFYATLLRVGYAALTAASEAVFLNEGRSVIARRMTWLEEDRLAEIEASRKAASSGENAWTEPINPSLDAGELLTFDLPERPEEWESGYRREKKIEKPSNASRPVQSQPGLGGVGAFQGAARCYIVFSFFRNIFSLLLRWFARGLSILLDRAGITFRPLWFSKFIGADGKGVQSKAKQPPPSLDFWILTDEGELELPGDNEFDVEKEMRKRENMNKSQWDETDENRLEAKLYNWWKAGGSWGNQDETADYILPGNDLDDTTSFSTPPSNDSEWEDCGSSRPRTLTQHDLFPAVRSREGSPLQETVLDTASLARLLNPRDRESKQEARVLAAHLAAEQDGYIMTRSRYRRQIERERAQVLMPPRINSKTLYRPGNSSSNTNERRRPTPEEEVEILENMILARRRNAASPRSEKPASWESGASGLGPGGPQCVICQTNPRSIITWPCRCLCLCEDCRVSLAMNNFGSCVTCRQEVGGFVRLWVP
ncbi:hypothetical protein Egran_02074 [Elaphomyces granulatus]|uniref:Ubiquitin-protein ligase n=1 Tax=Elaphomyces granulatus TaxID=519963 RepID=A0A232M192_9EURO|nr:hypothetical protein Egran_02074 [Elaphomyces granulatus]